MSAVGLPGMKSTTRHDLPGGGNIGAESDPAPRTT
jgi:hypothetical protein